MTSDDDPLRPRAGLPTAGRLGVFLLVALFAGALVACGGGQSEGGESERVSISDRNRARAQMSGQSQAALDSGNAAFRRGDYEGARKYYRQLVDREPDNAAGWVGIYMAERALGNEAAADSARERAAALSPEATRFHGGSGDSMSSPHDSLMRGMNMNRMGGGAGGGG